ncbi:hypothetical protein GGE31_003557 [Rhizobium cellulosilyticum]|uniref:Uncharacterized protein n=1 Tax=Aliirhizobium cellulosilyticum TaxID=393664 RepID=A0A7W6TIQ3_9HYPH|nr:hypothetical protein [Rhizobium cellulosilyticum]
MSGSTVFNTFAKKTRNWSEPLGLDHRNNAN